MGLRKFLEAVFRLFEAICERPINNDINVRSEERAETFDYIEDLYKEIYYREHERRENIRSGLNFPAGIIVILGGVLAFYITNLPRLNFDILTTFFGITLFGMLIGITWAVYHVFRVYYGHDMYFIATTKKLEDYRKDLQDYYGINDLYDEKTVDELRRFLVDQYIQCSTYNTLVNDKKSAYLHRANRGIIIALISLFLSLFPYTVLSISTPEIYQVEVINIREGGIKCPQTDETKEKK